MSNKNNDFKTSRTDGNFNYKNKRLVVSSAEPNTKKSNTTAPKPLPDKLKEKKQ